MCHIGTICVSHRDNEFNLQQQQLSSSLAVLEVHVQTLRRGDRYVCVVYVHTI